MESIKSGIHYHIRWSDSSIDWKRCSTKEEAKQLARGIKKPSETYTIVERDEECERCKDFESKTSFTPNAFMKEGPAS